MWASFAGSAKRILGEGIAAAAALGGPVRDCRDALCRWEDALFASFPAGHSMLSPHGARRVIDRVFAAFGRESPQLHLVPGFDDPRVGGFADVARNRIVIENGCLYRFLVLHESTHLLVPQDRHHGAVFIYVLQALYRAHLGIPESAVGELLRLHDLPSFTRLPPSPDLAIAA
jgi:hypothetical protein